MNYFVLASGRVLAVASPRSNRKPEHSCSILMLSLLAIHIKLLSSRRSFISALLFRTQKQPVRLAEAHYEKQPLPFEQK